MKKIIKQSAINNIKKTFKDLKVIETLDNGTVIFKTDLVYLDTFDTGNYFTINNYTTLYKEKSDLLFKNSQNQNYELHLYAWIYAVDDVFFNKSFIDLLLESCDDKEKKQVLTAYNLAKEKYEEIEELHWFRRINDPFEYRKIFWEHINHYSFYNTTNNTHLKNSLMSKAIICALLNLNHNEVINKYMDYILTLFRNDENVFKIYCCNDYYYVEHLPDYIDQKEIINK